MKITNQVVIDVIKKSVFGFENQELDSDASFNDLGVDSLDLMSVFLEVQEISGIEIPDEDIDALTNINSIVTYVNSKA